VPRTTPNLQFCGPEDTSLRAVPALVAALAVQSLVDDAGVCWDTALAVAVSAVATVGALLD